MRKLAVSLFGLLPASLLCILLLQAAVAILGEYAETGNREYLLLLLWCGSGLIGTFALYFSIDGPPGPVTMVGLGVGIATVFGLDGFSTSAGILRWLFAAPVIVAALLIIEGINEIYGRSAEIDE